MRFLLVIFIITLSFNMLLSQQKQSYIISNGDSMVTLEFNDTTFRRVTYFKEKNKKNQIDLIRRDSLLIPHGKYTVYENDIKLFEQTYKHGILTNSMRYYNSKEIESISSYKNGEEHYRILFYKNGNIKENGTIERGRKSGLWYYYYENSQIKKSGVYSLKLELTDYSKSKLEDKTLLDSEKLFLIRSDTKTIMTGCWSFFYENGILKKFECYD
jgi:antitoxin component YwqK of YwqJK toxin-antitoxin module